MHKRWIYEEALKMPFLLRFPGSIAPGTVIDSVVSNLDFAPTYLAVAALPKGSGMQGRSFHSVLQGDEPNDWENAAYHRYWMHMAHHDVPAYFGIRTKEDKMLFFYGLTLDATDAEADTTPPGWELYDLTDDPEENRNVYNDPSYGELRARALSSP